MKELYHLSISSHNEVLFRSQDDVNYCLNQIALAAYKTGTQVFADSLMSNHIHLVLEGENISSFTINFRNRYFKYFNRKYSVTSNRKLFKELSCYQLKMIGINHIITGISYVLRNGLHHGIAPTAFGYLNSSVNDYYKNELGKQGNNLSSLSRMEAKSALPRHSDFPDSYVMDSSGVFKRSSFEEIAQVEVLYASARSFLYYMNRISDGKWIEEQKLDKNGEKPITLDVIERCKGDTLSKMLVNEKGKFIRDRRSDLEICKIIDEDLIGKMGLSSVYGLNDKQRGKIYDCLRYEYFIRANQIRRCLVL